MLTQIMVYPNLSLRETGELALSGKGETALGNLQVYFAWYDELAKNMAYASLGRASKSVIDEKLEVMKDTLTRGKRIGDELSNGGICLRTYSTDPTVLNSVGYSDLVKLCRGTQWNLRCDREEIDNVLNPFFAKYGAEINRYLAENPIEDVVLYRAGVSVAGRSSRSTGHKITVNTTTFSFNPAPAGSDGQWVADNIKLSRNPSIVKAL